MPVRLHDIDARAAVPRQANHIDEDSFYFPVRSLTDVPFPGLISAAIDPLAELSRGQVRKMKWLVKV